LRGGVSFEAEANEVQVVAKEQAVAETAVNGVADGPALATKVSKASLKDGTQGYSVPAVSAAGGAAGAESRGGGEATAAEDPQVGAVLKKEELLTKRKLYNSSSWTTADPIESGLLVFQLVSGNLARRGVVEIMFDDGYWPSFTSTRARSNHQKWDQVSVLDLHRGEKADTPDWGRLCEGARL
jgi:hypothetical protein